MFHHKITLGKMKTKIKDRLKVLLVEDESTLAMIIKDTLDNEGFDTIIARNGRDGLEILKRINPSIIITDVMMPLLDGFAMVKEIRKKDRSTPVLFLTARASIDDLVNGFNLGANDYLKKPFKMLELVVRVKALTRSIEVEIEPDSIFNIGEYTLNCQSQLLHHGTDSQELSHMECEILRRLCQNKDRIVEINDILTEVWNNDNYYNRNSLHVFIHKLRKRLSRDRHIKILNIRGLGYKLTIQ